MKIFSGLKQRPRYGYCQAATPDPSFTRSDTGMTRAKQDTCHLYTDLAWLWPMWGDAATEYAHYCQHVSGLIRKYAGQGTVTRYSHASRLAES